MCLMFSEHISLQEFTYSATAQAHNIDNSLPSEYLPKTKILAETIFEPIRTLLGNKPIHLDSGYRCKALNGLLPGSSPTSQHCLAEALDILPCMDLEQAFLKILYSDMSWDQLMLEGFTQEELTPKWIHISSVVLNPEKNRNQIKIVEFDKQYNKYVYHQLDKQLAIQRIEKLIKGNK